MNTRLKELAEQKYNATFHEKESSPIMWLAYLFLQVVTWGKAKDFFAFSTTLGTRVYTHEDVSDATLAHEIVHLDQYKRLGAWAFCWKYVTRKGRLELEIEAYGMTNTVKADQGEAVGWGRLNRQAGLLTGPMYLWAGSSRAPIIARLLAIHALRGRGLTGYQKNPALERCILWAIT